MTGPSSVDALIELSHDLGPEVYGLDEWTILPDDHRELLRRANGLTLYNGAFRLFRLREGPLSLAEWNEESTWRFAWGERARGYLFIGETAFGDQYAYRQLPTGELAGPEIYFLQATLLTPSVIADSFGAFVAEELLRNAQKPYDHFIVDMIARDGHVGAGTNWTYAPSIALGGPEILDNVVTLPARTAMTYQGDIVTALDADPLDRVPRAVSQWTDELGRPRLGLEY